MCELLTFSLTDKETEKRDQSSTSTTPMATDSLSGTSVLPPVGSVHEGNPTLEDGGQQLEEEEGEGEGQSTVREKEKREEKKLAIMMMSKKRKRLYDLIMKSRRKKAKEVSELKRKRREFDETQSVSKRAKVS